MVLACWHIGREIVEEVQQGHARAGYGEAAIAELSTRLTDRYGRGCSERNLLDFRRFYWTCADRAPNIPQRSLAESRTVGRRFGQTFVGMLITT